MARRIRGPGGFGGCSRGARGDPLFATRRRSHEHRRDLSRHDLWVIPVIVAITFHEAAHGFVAHLLGDDTAWRLGRVIKTRHHFTFLLRRDPRQRIR
jgi:hypothetical protein